MPKSAKRSIKATLFQNSVFVRQKCCLHREDGIKQNHIKTASCAKQNSTDLELFHQQPCQNADLRRRSESKFFDAPRQYHLPCLPNYFTITLNLTVFWP